MPVIDLARLRNRKGVVHATDHDEAPILMRRAYRKVSEQKDWDRQPEQPDLAEIWREKIGHADDEAF
jgi:hypothetical protein